MGMLLEALSDVFTNGIPSLQFVVFCCLAFLSAWLMTFLCAIICCFALTSDTDERKLIADAFTNEGNNMFFYGWFYTLSLLLWHFNIFVSVCRVIIWIITVMYAFDLTLYLVNIVIGFWRNRWDCYYYSSFSEKIKDIAVVILQSLTTIINHSIYIFITTIITLIN